MWFWATITSVLVNVLLLLYTRWLLNFIETTNESLESIYDQISDFSEHTESVYELEMFYGDETLKSLMTHAKELSQKIKDIDLIINEDEEEEEIGEEKEKKEN